jgi:hypothetical protein
MSLKEAASAIGVPYRSVWYWYKLGLLPVQRIAGRALIEPEALLKTLRILGYRPRRTQGTATEV